MITDVSIIVRTLNEERYLPELLSAIKAQQSSFSREVILIDSGSTDRTLSIAKTYGCQILHISRKDFSFGRSLNRACEAARGNFFVFISGHCIPYDQSWMHSLVEPLANGTVQYSYGRQIGGAQTYWSEKQIFAKYFPEQSCIPQDGFYCNNANSAIASEIWKKYKFDEELTGLEDMHLAKRLVANQGKIGYIANSSVYHMHHENWRQVQRRFEREALALQQICPEVILRRRDLFRYFSRGIIRDVFANPFFTLRPRVLSSVILYRYHQFIGSYRGNHNHKKISSALRDAYFYPSNSQGKSLTIDLKEK
ncbi:glycosyltransferase family 2 protein [Synechococcus sp. A10-1-5-1]|uniref:glycosyltransferase n=1 Tax=Synechococcus sp. A10-1-5-1 TaxID=2936507 RepID=UPI0020015A61|nr:glycosyltransferase family 2 protein [Synechococcus sp. A10-1-5-1]UPM49181.1 glycosyltransferase family 2 protein [Synechococcus sp. A10-1-5-1]